STYPYCLTTSGAKALVESGQVPGSVVDSVGKSQPPFLDTAYPTWKAFTSALQTAINDRAVSDKYQAAFVAAAAVFTLDIAGWNFDLSTECWNDHGTILLFKFAPQSLSVLAQSTNGWYGRGAAFNASPTAAQRALSAFIDASRRAAASDPD